MAKNPLDEAESLFKRRRWAALISLLEPLSPLHRENKRFCYLLATAYLYRGDTGGAYSYYRRAQQLDFRDGDVAAGLAAVYLRRGESDKAIQLYIDALEREPGNVIAKKGLSYLKGRAAGEGERDDAPGLRGLFPRPPFAAATLARSRVVAVAVIIAFLAAPGLLERIASRPSPRPDIAAISLGAEERASPVGTQGGFSFVLGEKEALAAFDLAKKLFLEYRDEAALVEVNRLRLSNASAGLKAKAEALALYAREPSFLSLPDRFSMAEVNAFPSLYEGVGVVWKGLAANVQRGGGSTRFELLVGYHDKRRLEGIVLVQLPFEALFDPDKPIEVLARVRGSDKGALGYYLDCIAIHSF